MVAGPLVQGASRRRVALAATLHTLALLAGAALTATLLLGLRLLGRPAPAPAAAACFLAALLLLLERRLPTPGSRWMVPRRWAALGPLGYAAAFGFALGTGVLTVVPSAALYALLLVAWAAPAWWQAYVLMLAFGATRALLVPLLTARSMRRRIHPVVGSDRLRDLLARLGAVEALLVALLGVELLLMR